VKIVTEPGSSTDRVILIVDLEEKSTGDFSVSGGYSTDRRCARRSQYSERNSRPRLFAKASVTYGQYARGYSLSFVDPYLLDYRVALGLDLFQRQQLANSYIAYGTKTLGFSPRWASPCAKISLCNCAIRSTRRRFSCRATSRTVTTPPPTHCSRSTRRRLGSMPTVSLPQRQAAPPTRRALACWCYSDGEASLPVRKNCRAARP